MRTNGSRKKEKVLKYDVVVVGCGGTGTYFIKEAARFLGARHGSKITSFTIVDADIVEEKNLERQAFQTDDIGCYKADIMANACNEIFGLHFKSHVQYINSANDLKKLLSNVGANDYYIRIPVLIGCVDNHACRIAMEQYFEQSEYCVYFDSANEFSNGECVFAYKIDGKVISPCRSYYFPDIKKGIGKKRSDMSCTELNAAAPQHILTNMCAGIALLSAFIPLVEENKMRGGFSSFNPFLQQTSFCPFRKEAASL